MIYASLGLDWSQYAKGLNDAASSTKNAFGNITKALAGGDIKGAVSEMGTALASLPPPLVAAAAAAAIVGVAAKQMWDAMGKAKEMNIMAEQAGMTATQFSTLSKVFSKVGVDAEQLPGVMSKMAASMSEILTPGSKAADALARIGLTAEMLNGKSQYDQFKLIAKGINELSSASTKIQTARAIFGKSGAMLLPAMRPDAITKSEGKVSPMAKIAEESGGAFLAFQGAVKALKVDVGGFFAGMASNVVPALQSVVEQLGKVFYAINVALANAGKTMGEGIAFWITAAKEGFTGIGNAILSVFGAGVLLLINGVNAALTALTAGYDAIKEKLGFGKSITVPYQIDTTNIENNIAGLLEKINKRTAEDKLAAESRKTPEPGGLELTGKMQQAIPALITSSFTKVGALGGGVWGDQGINVQRDQLAVQQRIANSIDRFLQMAKPTENPYLGGVTPQLGVI